MLDFAASMPNIAVISWLLAVVPLTLAFVVGFYTLRLRKNLLAVKQLLERRIELAQIARAKDVAALWGAIADHVSRTSSFIPFTSQAGEDYQIWRLLAFKRDGFFVDVGAYDGVRGSNTYGLERLGWQGILVEANPVAAERCQINRPGSRVVHAAVGGCGAQGLVSFNVVTGDIDADMLSYMNSDERHGEMIRRANGRVKRVQVPFRSLNDILDANGAPRDIDLLSVDIEGQELLVVEGLDWNRFTPAVIVVEANSPQVGPFLESKGFARVAIVGANELFVRRSSSCAAFLSRPEFEIVRY